MRPDRAAVRRGGLNTILTSLCATAMAKSDHAVDRGEVGRVRPAATHRAGARGGLEVHLGLASPTAIRPTRGSRRPAEDVRYTRTGEVDAGLDAPGLPRLHGRSDGVPATMTWTASTSTTSARRTKALREMRRRVPEQFGRPLSEATDDWTAWQRAAIGRSCGAPLGRTGSTPSTSCRRRCSAGCREARQGQDPAEWAAGLIDVVIPMDYAMQPLQVRANERAFEAHEDDRL